MIKKTEEELKIMANQISNYITIRSYDEYGSVDDKRETTIEEKDILYKIAYGALFGFNWGNNTKEGGQAIADASEMILDKFIDGVNGYLTIYCPLKRAFREWED